MPRLVDKLRDIKKLTAEAFGLLEELERCKQPSIEVMNVYRRDIADKDARIEVLEGTLSELRNHFTASMGVKDARIELLEGTNDAQRKHFNANTDAKDSRIKDLEAALSELRDAYAKRDRYVASCDGTIAKLERELKDARQDSYSARYIDAHSLHGPKEWTLEQRVVALEHSVYKK